jgi:hypothetical protein
MMLPEDNNQIFAARYQTILPSKEELRKALDIADDRDSASEADNAHESD